MWGLKRGRASGPISAPATDIIFRTAKGAPGSAEGNDPTQRIVFRVTDIKEPTFDAASPEGKRLAETVRRSLAEDLFAQYLTRLQADLGTSINEEQLRRALGVGEAN
jgi:peptidyl-prolyl cis-trans isomerase D